MRLDSGNADLRRTDDMDARYSFFDSTAAIGQAAPDRAGPVQAFACEGRRRGGRETEGVAARSPFARHRPIRMPRVTRGRLSIPGRRPRTPATQLSDATFRRLASPTSPEDNRGETPGHEGLDLEPHTPSAADDTPHRGEETSDPTCERRERS